MNHYLKAWLLRFRDMDTEVYEQRQRLVDTFINSIYVFDDRIVVSFNYHDRSRTVKLDDIRVSSTTIHPEALREKFATDEAAKQFIELRFRQIDTTVYKQRQRLESYII